MNSSISSNLTNSGQNLNNTAYVAGALGFITLAINTFFFILGWKVLKKKAHNILVISMCAGDCLYGFSLISLVLVNRTGIRKLCLAQIALVFISMATSLTMALMICIERYITIKHYNFGFLVKSEGWKKKMSAVSVIVSTGFVLICLIAVPTIKNVEVTCILIDFYEPVMYQILMALLSGLFISITTAMIIVYCKVVCMLSTLIALRRQVVPVAIRIKETTSEQTSTDRVQRSNTAKSDEADKNHMWCTSRNENVTRMTSNEASSHQQKEDEITLSNLDISMDIAPTTIQRARSKDAAIEWERRALATSGYIILSTLLLHGPLIGCLFADALNIRVPHSVGNVSATLVAIQGVINPFLYAFRFQELRTAIKGIICCKGIDS